MRHTTGKRILLHILFWSLLKGYEIFFYTTNSNFEYAVNTSLGRFPGELILYYSGILYILPLYFENRNTRRFIFQWIITLIVAIIAHRTARYFLFPANRINNSFFATLFHIPSFFMAPFYFLPIPALGFISFIFRRLHSNELQKKESDKQRMIAEVNLLKSQIQPHFLFNTLNNIYGLALSSSASTPDSIMRLSKIMEYMLYNSEREQVPIGLEMQYIHDYIELEKLRYGKRLQVSWDIDDSAGDKLIAPLLLFPFIENAFKHGSGKHEGDTWISISLQKEEDAIVYIVVNSVPSAEGMDKGGNGRGHGLQNLRKRLNLAYPGKYILEQTPGDASYMSVLRLNL